MRTGRHSFYWSHIIPVRQNLALTYFFFIFYFFIYFFSLGKNTGMGCHFLLHGTHLVLEILHSFQYTMSTLVFTYIIFLFPKLSTVLAYIFIFPLWDCWNNLFYPFSIFLYPLCLLTVARMIFLNYRAVYVTLVLKIY